MQDETNTVVAEEVVAAEMPEATEGQEVVTEAEAPVVEEEAVQS